MKKHTFLFALVATMLSGISALQAQVPTVVQTLTYDSTARAGVWNFPNDTNVTYRKILMQYSMRCHDQLVGNGNVGCREWDYHCNTVITDSSRTDSSRANADSHVISNFGGQTYNISNAATYTYTQYTQKDVSYTSTIAETLGTVTSGAAALTAPFTASNPVARTQYLWTASELSTAGLTAGNISSLRMDVSALGSGLGFLRIRMKTTNQTALDPDNAELDGFTDVYFLNTTISGTGVRNFLFHSPFPWNGTSNILVDFSFKNAAMGTNTTVQGGSTGQNYGLQNPNTDLYLDFASAGHVDIGTTPFSNISNEITISFWAYGDASLPFNSTVFEGTDAGNVRQANVHLPWSNGQVYWDCGNDGSGYDRINLTASANDFKDRWTHWAFTKNAVTGEMKIYIDGVQFHSGTGKTKPIDLRNFRIGRSLTGSTAWSGRLNEFRIWNKELSATTIADWMWKDLTPSHPDYANLMAYYRLNEGTGTTVADASIHAQSGTISGVAAWRALRGKDLFRNFAVTQDRPNVTFVKGSYSMVINDVIVRDSVLNPQNSVVAYTVVGTDLTVVDTNFYYQAGYQYVYDENGVVVDSVLAATDSTINITTLTHYSKGPARYEILSFITPYGNGLDLGPNGVMWEFDVTDYAPILRGAKRMSVEGVGNNQEELDIRFLFVEGTPPRDVQDIQQIWPIRSAGAIWSGYGFNAILNDDVFEARDLHLAPNSSAWKLKSAVTGHGQNGEFIPRWHWLNVDGGQEEFRYRAWTECADIPVYPQGGTWLYDRAGWCPGHPTDVAEFELDTLGGAGQTVSIDYGMDQVSNTSASDYRINNQLVTYGVPNFSVDASVIAVKRPTDRTRYARFNPACNEPIILLRNEGSTALNSVKITYNVRGGTTRDYTWNGSLEFLESTEIALPVDNPAFWQGTDQVFEVSLSEPNGGTDQQPANDTISSNYQLWDNYSGVVELMWRTNNNTQTAWKIYDETQAIVMQSSPFIGPNTTYIEAINLPMGCYTLEFTDAADDGLYYWANTGQGSGWARMRENGSITQVFEPEFGKFFRYDFWTDGTVGNEEIRSPQMVTVYPNPNEGQFTVRMEGYVDRDVLVEIFDLSGKQVYRSAFNTGNAVVQEVVDLSGRPAGTYLLKVYDGYDMQTRRISVQ